MFSWLKKQEKVDTRGIIIALVATIAMYIVNGLAGSTTLLGGQDTAAVSDKYANLFAPAGFTFAIWGVIYLLLALFFVRAFGFYKPKKSAIDNHTLNEVVVYVTLSSVLNALWLFAWQFEQLTLSVVLMLLLLVALIRIHRLLVPLKFTDWKEYAMLRLPFSVYFGWITIATIANITTWLVSLGWDRWGQSEGTWMVATLLIGATIVLTTAVRGRDIAYLVVGVWAFAGILYKHLDANAFNGAYPSTIITLAILLAVFISVAIRLVPLPAPRKR